MKKTLLILYIVAFSQVGKTQTYIPVIEENKYWQEFFWMINGTACDYDSAKLYFFEGDSTILGETYKKLYYYNILPATSYGLCYHTYIDFSQKYFTEKLYREDILEKKVYVFEHPDIEYLVADFNLEVDDIYTHEDPSAGGVPMTVTNIEDIIIETGEIRKKWEFDGGGMPSSYLIEGLGYQGRIFNPFSTFLGSEYEIRCIHENDILLLGNGNCAGHLTIEENEKEELEIKTYPNPVQDIFTIEFTETQNEPFQIQVFDVTGKLVLENIFEKNTKKVELNCQNLNDGMYFYQITQNNGVNLGSGKMVVG